MHEHAQHVARLIIDNDTRQCDGCKRNLSTPRSPGWCVATFEYHDPNALVGHPGPRRCHSAVRAYCDAGRA